MRWSLSQHRVTKMKIKALWGFRGDAPKLKSLSADVKAGDVFPDVEPEYGHALVGKGLAVQIHEGAAPKETKPTKPNDLKTGEDSGSAVTTTDASAGEVTGSAGAPTSNGEASGGAALTVSVSNGPVGTPESSDQAGADRKAFLIQQLEAAGVDFDRRWGADRLAAVLAEAQNKDPA